MRLLTIFATLPLVACTADVASTRPDKVAASGTGTSRTFAVADFTGVELAASDNVDVRVGSAFSVRAEGPSERLDQLVIKKRGATLSIGREAQALFTSSKGDDAKVFVTMPNITAASLSGSGNLHVDTVGGAAFSATLAGSGDLSIDAVTSTSTKLELGGSGNISVKGAVEHLSMSVVGSGNIEATGLSASTADVSVAGSGNVSATVNGAANVSMVGSGTVTLGKGAVCTTKALGSGAVHCG